MYTYIMNKLEEIVSEYGDFADKATVPLTIRVPFKAWVAWKLLSRQTKRRIKDSFSKLILEAYEEASRSK